MQVFDFALEKAAELEQVVVLLEGRERERASESFWEEETGNERVRLCPLNSSVASSSRV